MIEKRVLTRGDCFRLDGQEIVIAGTKVEYSIYFKVVRTIEAIRRNQGITREYFLLRVHPKLPELRYKSSLNFIQVKNLPHGLIRVSSSQFKNAFKYAMLEFTQTEKPSSEEQPRE